MSTEITKEKFKDIMKRVSRMKESGEVDLSTEEDLAVGVMNLISLEEHLFFTSAKTGNDEYLSMLNDVRNMRKELLGRMISRHEGETWCTSKHLLAASMRLIEVGTKLYSDGKTNEAKAMFDKAHQLFALFWALRLKLAGAGDVRAIAGSGGKAWSYEDILDKLVDCCDE